MPRDIRFRAWVKNGGKRYNSNVMWSWEQLLESYWAERQSLLNWWIYSHGGDPNEHHWKEDIVLMQFTGLTDKNGKEIYEGDIIQEVDLNTRIYRVDWSDYRWVLTARITERHFKDAFQMEVIGNVWENPELLTIDE